MSKKCLIIFNSVSKKSYFHNSFTNLVNVLVKEGYEVEAYATQARRDSIAKIKRSGPVDLIVCAGGDGTINEITNAVVNYASGSEILYFPTGTVNDYAYSLGIKKNFPRVVELLEQKQVNLVDIGDINGMYFNYVAAIGHFTSASYATDQRAKNFLGSNAYIINGITNFKKEEAFFRLKLDIDGEKIDDEFKYCIIANSKSVGGIRKLFPNNRLDDGKFLIFLVKKDHGLSAIEVPSVLINGINSQDSLSENLAIVREFSNVKIEMEQDITWTVDGEEGPTGNVEISVHKQKIKIYSNLGDK